MHKSQSKLLALFLGILLMATACAPADLADFDFEGLSDVELAEFNSEDAEVSFSSDALESEDDSDGPDGDSDSSGDESDEDEDSELEDFEISGTIEALSASSVRVNGFTFQIDENTKLDDGLALGVFAKVEFVVLEGPVLLALEIETDADDGPDSLEAEDAEHDDDEDDADEDEDNYFFGVLESLSETSAIIGGQIFIVDENTELDDGLVNGVIAKVEFIVLADGSFLALEIETDADDDLFDDDGEDGDDDGEHSDDDEDDEDDDDSLSDSSEEEDDDEHSDNSGSGSSDDDDEDDD